MHRVYDSLADNLLTTMVARIIEELKGTLLTLSRGVITMITPNWRLCELRKHQVWIMQGVAGYYSP